MSFCYTRQCRCDRALGLAEGLEARVFLSSSGFARVSSRGTLIVSGSATADVIHVSLVDAQDKIDVSINGPSLSFARAAVARIYVDADAGADIVDVSAGPVLKAVLRGGAGNDTLIGSPGKDELDGGAGDDVLDGRGSNDTLVGGVDDDIADYHKRGTGFTFTVGEREIPPTSSFAGTATSQGETDVFVDVFETIGGTARDDIFNPASTVDLNENMTVTVTLFGRGGNDRFFDPGSLAVVVEKGDAGDDSFARDEDGVAQMHGGSGDDTFRLGDMAFPVADINGGPGSDALDLTGSDAAAIDLNRISSVENAVGIGGGQLGVGTHVIGTPGPNRLKADEQFFSLSRAPITIEGGGGDDLLIGSPLADFLDGGAGNDSIDGGGGNDLLLGGPGNDTVIGGGGRDRLYGSDGNDTIFARDGIIDRLYGGGGSDAARADASQIAEVLTSIETLLP